MLTVSGFVSGFVILVVVSKKKYILHATIRELMSYG